MERAEPERTLTSSGSLAVAEFLVREFFEARETLRDLRAELLGIFAAVLEEVVAGFRGDGEAGRDRQADARHLRETGALAAEQVVHVAVAVRFACSKKINVFHF